MSTFPSLFHFFSQSWCGSMWFSLSLLHTHTLPPSFFHSLNFSQHTLSLPLSFTHSISLLLSLSDSVSSSLWLFLTLSRTNFINQPLSYTHTLYSFFLTHIHALSLSHTHNVSLSYQHTHTFFLSHTLTQQAAWAEMVFAFQTRTVEPHYDDFPERRQGVRHYDDCPQRRKVGNFLSYQHFLLGTKPVLVVFRRCGQSS